MVHNFAEKSAKLWTFHFLNSILTPWERAGLWSPCRVHYQLGLRVQVGRGYCADHRRWYALIYSVGRRQSNAVRLARARRERRHRPPAAFVAQQRKKLWQPANVSMPRYAMVRDCNIAPPKQPQRSRMMSRTSFLTMTSPLIFSASVRTSSTSASPSVCLFSTRTAQRLCACWEWKCYCRFTPADSHGRISKILYAKWRKPVSPRVDTSTFAPRFGEQIFLTNSHLNKIVG